LIEFKLKINLLYQMSDIKYLFALLLLMSSCSISSQNQHEVCEETVLHLNNEDNDTSTVILRSTWVYDTITQSIQGLVLDDDKYKPIENALVLLRLGDHVKRDTTDKNGEFKMWGDLVDSIKNYNLQISHPKYKCLIVYEIIQSGGQSIVFKLKRK